jgi:hypothetical protein
LQARKNEQDPKFDSDKKESSVISKRNETSANSRRPYEKNSVPTASSLRSAASFTAKSNSLKKIDSGIDKNIAYPRTKRTGLLNSIDE